MVFRIDDIFLMYLSFRVLRICDISLMSLFLSEYLESVIFSFCICLLEYLESVIFSPYGHGISYIFLMSFCLSEYLEYFAPDFLLHPDISTKQENLNTKQVRWTFRKQI